MNHAKQLTTTYSLLRRIRYFLLRLQRYGRDKTRGQSAVDCQFYELAGAVYGQSEHANYAKDILYFNCTFPRNLSNITEHLQKRDRTISEIRSK